MSDIVQWNAVTRRYGKVTAVEDVSLVLRPGEVVALVGHNGAGKTTLIKLLLGLVRPTAGAVRVLDVDPAGAHGAQARRKLGFLPENVAFHGAMTGTELMRFYARLKGCPVAGNAALLERVGLAGAADRPVSTYSKGMRQRLGIAQALVGAPRLFVFDEPTSGLDPASRVEVFEMIGELRASGATILVSTHALAEVENRVDRVAIMHRGHLLACGSMGELRQGTEASVRIRLRTAEADRVEAHLPDWMQRTRPAAGVLEVEVAAARKMEAMRVLCGLAGFVDDIDIATPGLEELYRHLVTTRQGTAALAA